MSGARWSRALVTGASSGIGEALARRLAAAGTHLVVVARSADALERLATELRTSVDVEVLVADLADPTQVASVVARIDADDRPVDLVVNNAGFGAHGDHTQADVDAEIAMIAVNIEALVRLTHAAGRALARRGGGDILNVSSIAGASPSPGVAVYSATKSFVTSFSQAVHDELAPLDVGVTVVCPGFTRTDFQRRADYDASSLPGFLWQSADTVAAASLRATARRRATVVPGWHNKVAVGASRLVPSTVLRRVVRLLQG